MKKIQKIAFLGNFNVPFTSESHYLKTLKNLGYEVYPLQEGTDSINTIMSKATKMDMFFWVHTHGWNTPGIAEGLEILREQGIPSIGYHLDLWLGIQRERDLDRDPYWNVDYFFSVDKLMVDLLNSRENMPKSFFLPAGVFDQECVPGNYRSDFDYDVIFVGSKRYHKEWQYRTQLINWLESKYGDRFGLFGKDGLGQVRGQELNDLYASAKVVVGDTLCKGFNYPYYLSDRVFETTGRGGFMIHPFISGIEDLFVLPEMLHNESYITDKAEIVTYPFGKFEYLEYIIDYYIKNEQEREEIKRRGHERTKRDHTYKSRLQYMIKTIEGDAKRKED